MLDFEFMRLAFAAGLVVGLVAPVVGFFLVQRRMSLIGDGIGHVSFAGVVLISAAGALNVNLLSYLFGSILTTTRSDVATIAVLGVGALALIGVSLRSLLAVSLDEEAARVAGLPIALLNGIVSTLAALTIGVSMRIVGILLIAALMVLPVISASRIAWSVRSAILLAMAIGLVSTFVGLIVSYYADLAPGGAIVLVAAGSFPLALLASTTFGRR